MNKEHIMTYLSRIKDELTQYGIDKIGLFGSFANGKADTNSDIDIVIRTTPSFVKQFDGASGFLYLEDLRQQIEKKFHRHVDICDEAGLKDNRVIKDAIYA